MMTFAAVAFIGTCALAEEAELESNKTKTITTQEVQTGLPTTPSGKPVAPPSEPAKVDNREAAKLAEFVQKMQYCVDNKDRTLRLRCYDEMAVELGVMSDPFKMSEREKLASYGFWNVMSERDPLGIETLYLTIAPYNRLQGTNLSTRTPTFNIRCRQGNTDAYLDWKGPLHAGRQYVREIYIYIKVENEPEYRLVWQLSLDGMAAFSPDPISFVKKLRTKSKLLVRVTPLASTMETMSFEIGMLDKALDIMVKRCYAAGSGQDAPANLSGLPIQ